MSLSPTPDSEECIADDEPQPGSVTMIRSCCYDYFWPPDIIVVVGSEEMKQEFKCNRAILSNASKVFRATLGLDTIKSSPEMIELLDKDPKEWELFYQFIHPANFPKITEYNVMQLIPWFHEFQMDSQLKICDDFLATEYFRSVLNQGPKDDAINKLFWSMDSIFNENDLMLKRRYSERRDYFQEVLDLLEVAHIFDLQLTMNIAEKALSELMLLRTHDLFDHNAVKLLLSLVLPVIDTPFGLKSSGRCKNLWPSFAKILEPQSTLYSLSANDINNSASLPLLVYSFMHKKLTHDRSL